MRRTVLKKLPLIAVLVFLAAWIVFLRPAALGGPATYVVVSGSSMEPALMPGDLVVARERSSYSPGDVAVFTIPEGQPGGGSDAKIVHRLTGGDDDRGFTTRGDNLDKADPWTPAEPDIAGSLWLHLPGGGDVLVWLLQPLVLGVLAGGLTTFMILMGGRSVSTKKGSTTKDGPVPVHQAMV